MRESGIQAIIQKINADAERHSGERYAHLKYETDREADAEKALFEGDLSKRRDMLINTNKHEYTLLYDRMSSRFHRDLLTYRQVLIDEIFDMAAARLRNASPKEFHDMFAAAVKGLKGNFTLYVGALSKGMLDGQMVEKVKNGKLNIALSPEPIPGKSGFLLKDERVEYNCLFEDLIEDMKNERSALILKEVFGDA